MHVIYLYIHTLFYLHNQHTIKMYTQTSQFTLVIFQKRYINMTEMKKSSKMHMKRAYEIMI